MIDGTECGIFKHAYCPARAYGSEFSVKLHRGHGMNIHGSHRAPLLAGLAFLVALMGFSFDVRGAEKAAGKAVKGEAAKDEAESVISVEIGKALMVPLDTPADVVMLGNPTVADVVVEGEGRIFLLGREPGETNLLILDEAGKVILSSAIVVKPLDKRRVTVDRGPQSFTLSCTPRCSPVATPQGTGATTALAAPADGGAAGGQTSPSQTPLAGAAAGAAGGAAPGGIDSAALATALSGILGGQSGSQ
jgi:hypothetical protein